MKKLTLLSFFLLLAGFASVLAQGIAIQSPPPNNCIECDTLKLTKGKPCVLFVNIGSKKLPIEKADHDGNLHREWKELQANFGNKVELKYTNEYGIVVAENTKLLDFRNIDEYYTGVYYWDGKSSGSVKTLDKNSYLAEQVGSLIGKKGHSSYKDEYEKSLSFFENLIQNNSPSKDLIKNLRYCNEFRDKGMEYLPYQFLTLDGIKKVVISTDSLFQKNRFTISLTPECLIDTLASYKEDEGKEYIDKTIGYKNGLFVNSKKLSYAYKGDTLIQYSDISHHKSATAFVLENKMFLTCYNITLDPITKQTKKHVYSIKGQSEGSVTVTNENGSKSYYSNTQWSLPLTMTKSNRKIQYTLLHRSSLQSMLKLEVFQDTNSTPELEILYKLNNTNDRVESATVKNKRRGRELTLYYRYILY